MKIFTMKVQYSDDIFEITETNFLPCCKKVQEAWDSRFIGFGDFDKNMNTINNVCIYTCSVYPEVVTHETMPITFCPFCGTKIEIIKPEDSPAQVVINLIH